MKNNMTDLKAHVRRPAFEARDDNYRQYIAGQMNGLSKLNELSLVLNAIQEPERMLQAILQAIAELHGTNFGLLSLYDAPTERMEISASLGFNADFIADLAALPPGEGACAIAQKEKRRVIVEDTEIDPLFRPLRPLAQKYGFRAMHSTPILTRAGESIGVLAIHFPAPRRPTEPETIFTDMCVRQIADFMERLQAEKDLRLNKARLAAELEAMRTLHECSIKLTTAADLATALREVLAAAVSVTKADYGQVHLASAQQNMLHTVASHGFTQARPHPFDIVAINDNSTICGAAAVAGQRVFMPDIPAPQELFSSGANVPPFPGCRAAQSTPLLNRTGDLLGILSTYFNQPHAISDRDLRLMDLCARQAADIIDKMRAENELRLSERRLRLATEKGSIGIWEMDIQQGAGTLSGAAVDILGKGLRKTFCADDWAEECHPDDKERLHTAWEKTVIEDHPYEVEFRLKTPAEDGGESWVMTRGRIERDNAGTPVYGSGVVFDITARKRIEEALQEADRRKNEFLATLAHELRNPLAPIKNAIFLLQSPEADKDVKSRAQKMMETQVFQMQRLVDDLMDVARITQGKFELRNTVISLHEVISTAIETARPLIEKKGHRLDIILPEEDIVVRGDEVRLPQIFANLLNNAAKYTDKGSVSISARREGREAVIRVTDSGIGIPKNMQSQIFNMFVQVDNSLDRSYGGLGIGLTLVKNLVDMHGGSISVYSAGPGQGSEFTVRLPVSSRKEAGNNVHHGSDESPLSPRRVLIVDDNVPCAQTLAWGLELMGHDIKIAHSADTAMKTAREFMPEMILLDIGLPRVSGYELCRMMRQEPGLKDAVIVAQTGWGQKEHLQESERAGFDRHLVKPVDMKTLQQIFIDFF